MTEKKTRGRQIHVEMPADEYDAFKALATKQDLSMQQLARRCIRAYMEGVTAAKRVNSPVIDSDAATRRILMRLNQMDAKTFQQETGLLAESFEGAKRELARRVAAKDKEPQ